LTGKLKGASTYCGNLTVYERLERLRLCTNLQHSLRISVLNRLWLRSEAADQLLSRLRKVTRAGGGNGKKPVDGHRGTGNGHTSPTLAKGKL